MKTGFLQDRPEKEPWLGLSTLNENSIPNLTILTHPLTNLYITSVILYYLSSAYSFVFSATSFASF